MRSVEFGLTSVTLRAHGDATVAAAWERYERIELWPTWSPQIRSVESSGPRIGVGVTGTVHSFGPLAVRFRVESVNPAARTWSWRVGLGPLRIRLQHRVDESGTGSSTTLRILAAPILVAPYLPVAALALRRLVRA